jgi:hypothetical protein
MAFFRDQRGGAKSTALIVFIAAARPVFMCAASLIRRSSVRIVGQEIDSRFLVGGVVVFFPCQKLAHCVRLKVTLPINRDVDGLP